MEAAIDLAEHRLKFDGPRNLRLLVVDDHAVVQLGLRVLLGRQEWVQRCVVASDMETAIELTSGFRPHLALIDVFIGGESGLEVCRAAKRVRPEMELLLMSGRDQISPGVARAAGAIGFVSKSWSPTTLVEAVRRAACGNLVFNTSTRVQGSNLTGREMDVLEQIAAGASNPEVATALELSPHTVKQHTSSLYRKLGVRNRTEAVRHAQRLGLIT